MQVEVDSAKVETEFVQNQAAAAIDAKNMTKEIKRKLQESLKQVLKKNKKTHKPKTRRSNRQKTKNKKTPQAEEDLSNTKHTNHELKKTSFALKRTVKSTR